MPQTKSILVKDLNLDLNNFRTVKQPSELEAIKAMISISPDRFWGLMDSLLDDGYLPTENIIVIRDSSNRLFVKEGNRRIAVLKIIYGLIDNTLLNIPVATRTKISNVSLIWKADNKKVPCTIFEESDKALVDKVVTMAHGKGVKASRDPWASIAKARHNRDVNHASEFGLDLLEKYLEHGRNINAQQKERFGGDYPLSVLDAAIAKIAVRLGAANVSDLVSKYPALVHVNGLEALLLDIGQGLIGFEVIRGAIDFALKYSIPALPAPQPQPSPSPSPVPTPSPSPSPSPTPTNPSPANPSPSNPTPPLPPPPAAATNTPKSVMNKLRIFSPLGLNREKVVALRDEMLKLDIGKTPIAFCFLLRSLFEISSKAYCIDKSLPTTQNGRDKALVDLLRSVTNHITGGATNHPKTRELHGALTQLATSDGLLSVTSMNQLVHNTNFSVSANDICVLFHNIYPLLEEMN